MMPPKRFPVMASPSVKLASHFPVQLIGAMIYFMCSATAGKKMPVLPPQLIIWRIGFLEVERFLICSPAYLLLK